MRKPRDPGCSDNHTSYLGNISLTVRQPKWRTDKDYEPMKHLQKNTQMSIVNLTVPHVVTYRAFQRYVGQSDPAAVA